MNRIGALALTSLLFAGTLALGPAGLAAGAECTARDAFAIVDTIYLDIHDHRWVDPTTNPNGFAGNAPGIVSETHVYLESNGVRLLQRAEGGNDAGMSDSYGTGCTNGDTLLF